MKRKELLKLPVRDWDKITTYNAILVVPSGKKHDSGYMWMCIIGVDEKQNPVEIAACCDDIQWIIPEATEHDFRNDMYFPSGIIQFHSYKYNFKVKASLSTTEIELVIKPIK